MSDAVALLKQSLTLSSLVGRYTDLKAKGARLAGRCPFHTEKTASFYVDDNKGLFYCFGCKKGGDLLKFAQDIEHLEFTESLDFLAELAGVELPKHKGRGPGRDVIEQLRALNESAAEVFVKQFRSSELAKDYVKQRGLSDMTLRLFAVGYADETWDSLYILLKEQNEAAILRQSGLFKEGQGGRVYDLFRDRLMFPIRDSYGHLIAFGGRLIEGEGPKYVNSPETPLFTKGQHVYNLNHAKLYLKKQPYLIVVEGYTDVLQLCQAGINHVVASLGTAFTPAQAKLLKRYTNQVILNFDGDQAGFKAARTSIERLLSVGMEISIVSLPDGADPDSFVREQGIEAYNNQIDQALNFFDFLLRYFSQDQAQDDPHVRSALIHEMVHTLKEIDDPVVREHYENRLCGELGVTRDALNMVWKKGSAAVTRKPSDKRPEENIKEVHFSKLESEFLFQILHDAACYSRLVEEHPELPDVLTHVFAEHPTLFEVFESLVSDDLHGLLDAQPIALQKTLREIYFSAEFEVSADRNQVLLPDLVISMIHRTIDLNSKRLRALDALDHEGKRALMLQNQALTRQLHQL